MHATRSLLFAALSPILVAQGPAPSPDDTTPKPLAAPGSAISQAFGVGHTDGVTWAASSRYKAIFGPGTVEFTPALGTRAPRNLPVRFTTESIERGGTRVFTAPEERLRAEPQVDGNTVFFDHGHGIVERYDAAADHLEQSFVFASQPAGNGDLVVRLRLDTELEAETGEGLDTLRFLSEFGGVDIGRVVGIDAVGARAPGTMNFDGSHLELALGDAFVRDAAYPLVLDPPIGAFFTIDNSNTGNCCPDIAYDASYDIYFVVWQNAFSATDSDVLGIRVTTLGALIPAIVPIAWETTNETEPAVCNVLGRDKFFVVWTEERNGQTDIVGRAIHPQVAAMDPKVDLAASPLDERRADASGFIGIGNDVAIVVYEDGNFFIRSKVVQLQSPTGYLVQTAPFFGPGGANPAISKSSLQSESCVVWEVGDDLHFQILRGSSPGTSTGQISFPQPLSNPDVDGDGDTWLIAFERDVSTTPSGVTDVWAADVSDPDPGSLSNPPAIGNLAAFETGATDDDSQPSVCMLYPGSWGTPMWVVTISDSFGGAGGNNHLWSRKAAGSPWDFCGPWHQLRGGADDANASAAASTFHGGGTPDGDAMIVYATNGTDVDGQRWESFAGGTVAPIAGAPGCGAGGSAWVDGAAALGNQDFGFVLGGADPFAAGAFWVANFGNQPLQSTCGAGCMNVNPVLQTFVPMSGGAAQKPFGLPCAAAFVGLPIQTQWAVISNQPGGCPAFPFIHLSNAILVTLAY